MVIKIYTPYASIIWLKWISLMIKSSPPFYLPYVKIDKSLWNIFSNHYYFIHSSLVMGIENYFVIGIYVFSTYFWRVYWIDSRWSILLCVLRKFRIWWLYMKSIIHISYNVASSQHTMSSPLSISSPSTLCKPPTLLRSISY